MLGQVAVGVGLLVGVSTLWQMRLRWRARPFDELRSTLSGIRTLLLDAVARGGLSARHYTNSDAQQLETRLREVIPQLRDRKLRWMCKTVLEQFKGAFGSSSPPRVIVNPNTVDPAHEERRARQVEHARAGLIAIDAAVTRVNTLSRWVIDPS